MLQRQGNVSPPGSREPLWAGGTNAGCRVDFSTVLPLHQVENQERSFSRRSPARAGRRSPAGLGVTPAAPEATVHLAVIRSTPIPAMVPEPVCNWAQKDSETQPFMSICVGPPPACVGESRRLSGEQLHSSRWSRTQLPPPQGPTKLPSASISTSGLGLDGLPLLLCSDADSLCVLEPAPI